jgi:DMSO reductase anchor subunit
LSAMLTKLAVASLVIAVVAERWLFFGEAEHVVTVYYGANSV